MDKHTPEEHTPDEHSPAEHTSPNEHGPEKHSPDGHSPDDAKKLGMKARLRLFLLAALCIVFITLKLTGVLNGIWPDPAIPDAENRPSVAGSVADGPHGENGAETPAIAASAPTREAGTEPGLAYEERGTIPLEDGVRQIDAALLDCMRGLGINKSRLELIYLHQEESDLGPYTFQRLVLYPAAGENDAGSPEFFDALAAALALSAPEAALEKSERLASIRLHGLTTHEIRLVPPFTSHRPEQGARQPRLAIVIDDMGESLRAAQTLIGLDYPVTFSVWPDATRAKAVAEAAHQAGLEVMIHQPMEPMGYPGVKPGPRALLMGQTHDRIVATVEESAAKVPHAVGINNHMGSRITQDRPSMDAVVDAVLGLRGEQPLFILDSLTHSRSVLYATAKNAGIRAYRRDVFLDVEEEVGYILHQLDKAAQVARQRGQAVAIGHPLPETLEALKIWQTTRDPGVLIVPLANLNP